MAPCQAPEQQQMIIKLVKAQKCAECLESCWSTAAAAPPQNIECKRRSLARGGAEFVCWGVFSELTRGHCRAVNSASGKGTPTSDPVTASSS